MYLLVVSSGFPPLMGYSTLLTLCGFIFGSLWGFIPAYLGGLTGALGCFLLYRRWLGVYYRERIFAMFPKAKLIEDAINSGGFQVSENRNLWVF